MDISESDLHGRWFAGMPATDIQIDGTFTLLMPEGRRYFGMYFGPKWRGVNTDQLFKNGIEVIAGKTTELEIRVRRRDENQSMEPTALSGVAATHLAEQAAIAAIKQLGGWVAMEAIDGIDHVIEVNMVYHEDDRLGREENRLICDESLSYLQKFPKLKRLLLYREQATDEALANLRGINDLEEIYVWDASAVSDAGTKHLAGLKNLRVVHLDHSKITDESLRYFSELPRLEKLSLQGSHFTDEGLEHLQQATQLKELVLGLGTNEITDDGLRFLSGLTHLERLGLQNCKISDAGLQHLRPLKNLTQLWLGGTDCTEDGLKELRRDLPKLE